MLKQNWTPTIRVGIDERFNRIISPYVLELKNTKVTITNRFILANERVVELLMHERVKQRINYKEVKFCFNIPFNIITKLIIKYGFYGICVHRVYQCDPADKNTWEEGNKLRSLHRSLYSTIPHNKNRIAKPEHRFDGPFNKIDDLEHVKRN